MTHSLFSIPALMLGLALASSPVAATAQAARPADYIVAVVNNELVTQGELTQRLVRARDEATRAGGAQPTEAELRRLVLESLINERVIVTWARDSGIRVDEPELDRAVANIANMNKLTQSQLRDRLRDEGLDYARFRANLRDQILAERVREREVPARIKISDAEIQDYIDEQRTKAGQSESLNIAQILVTVPEGANEATVARLRAKAQDALARVQGGEAFDKVARELSEDANRERGGEIGARPVARLPDVFVDALRNVPAGSVRGELLRTGAGFHVLKVVERQEGVMTVQQTRARHVLLRPSAGLSAQAAGQRLGELRAQVLSGKRDFESVAREVSEDGSAARGGDLGWAAPGQFVPEFEEVMGKLQPGEISPPFASRFGVHIIQVLERRSVPVEMKQLREQARNALREQKYEAAYNEWAEELRSRAYVEMREPPQ